VYAQEEELYQNEVNVPTNDQSDKQLHLTQEQSLETIPAPTHMTDLTPNKEDMLGEDEADLLMEDINKKEVQEDEDQLGGTARTARLSPRRLIMADANEEDAKSEEVKESPLAPDEMAAGWDGDSSLEEIDLPMEEHD